MRWLFYQYIVPSLDDGDEQCHLHLQLFVVYHSLLREVHVCQIKFWSFKQYEYRSIPNLSL